MITPQRIQEIFVATRMHLTSSYDFFKYNGKLKKINKITEHDYKLSNRLITEQRAFDFFVANQIAAYLENGKVSSFIGDFANRRGVDRYYQHLKDLENQYKYVCEDTEKVFLLCKQDGIKFSEFVKDSKKVFELLLSKTISVYTILAYIKIVDDLIAVWKQNDDPLLSDVTFFLERLAMLIKNNPKEISKSIIKAKENLNVTSRTQEQK